MSEPWNEPGLTPQARALRRNSAVWGAFRAYVEWWQAPGSDSDAEPDVPAFLDDSYTRGELKRAARTMSTVLRNHE